MITVSNIYKQYGGKSVLNGVSLEAEKGEVLGILGANGVGKTTLIEIIAGLRRADVGVIKVTGCDLRSLSTVPNLIGFVADSFTAYPLLTAREYLSYLLNCASISNDEAEKRVELLLKMFGLSEEKRLLKTFSNGMKQKISIAAALIPNPEIIIMDEPTKSLDIEGKRELFEIIKRLKNGGKTVILTTHNLYDVNLLCDKVAVLEKGRVLFCEKVSDILKGDYLKFVLTTSNVEEASNLAAALCSKDYTIGCKAVFAKILLMTENRNNMEIQLLRDIEQVDVTLEGFSKIDVSFDEAFARRLKNARK